MAKNNYEIARGDYSSPMQSYETDSKNDVSADTAQRYLLAVRDIVNECIERRIRGGQDIAQVYTAEITDKTVVDDIVTAITVRYNDEDYADISNDTVRILDINDKFIKICTYDGVQFYVLHRM